MFTTFMRHPQGTPVAVNAGAVHSVYAGPEAIVIRFSESESVAVMGIQDMVVDQLNKALR
jgi:hypothetical protein